MKTNLRLDQLVGGKHIIELRNGEMLLVVRDKDGKVKGAFEDGDTGLELNNYNNDLTNGCDDALDVIKVYYLNYLKLLGEHNKLEDCLEDLVWERNNKIECIINGKTLWLSREIVEIIKESAKENN